MRAAFAALLLLASMSAASAPARAGPPVVEADTLDGRRFRLADFHGQVVLLNFWATWCAPCRAEMPAIDAYYQANRGRGLAVLAISMDTPNKAKAVRQIAGGFHFPVAMAEGAKLPSSMRPTQLPVTLVFDRTGALRFDSRKSNPGALTAQTLAGIVGPLL